jgi:hypothetical protein
MDKELEVMCTLFEEVYPIVKLQLKFEESEGDSSQIFIVPKGMNLFWITFLLYLLFFVDFVMIRFILGK